MANRFNLDEIKDLFHEDAMRFIDGMRAALAQLVVNPHDQEALDRLRACGHSLKGSAGLVDLAYLSHAGAIVDRAGEIASGYLDADVAQALAIFEQTQSTLPKIEALLDSSLSGPHCDEHEQLYTEIHTSFSDSVRRYLRTLESDDSKSSDLPPAASATPADTAWMAELAAAFQEELRENLDRVQELLPELRSPAHQRQAFHDLSRVFHTIKGSAAMVGRSDISDLARYLQDAFGHAADNLTLPEDGTDTVQSALEGIFASANLAAPPLALATTDATQALEPPALRAADIDPELMDAFTIDASEAIDASERLLLELERRPEDRDVLHALFRHFHTLKGAAAAVGLEAVAEQMHHSESLLDAVLNGERHVDSARLVDFLFRLTDSVTALINAARGIADTEHPVLQNVAAQVESLSTAAPAGPALAAQTTSPAQSEDRASTTPSIVEMESVVRIQASRLDVLMNQVTQLVVSRTRMDRKIEAFGELRDKLDYCRRRLAHLIQGFQEHYEYTIVERGSGKAPQPAAARNPDFFTDLEFDKYDDVNILARSVIELATDTGEIADQLGKLIDSFGEESRQFSKITSSLQRQITRLRLVPLDTVYRRLVRPVRDAARQEGKVVELQLDGGDVQLDKAIVEALHAPLLHLVRNAVSHGIEAPAMRQANGKATAGRIRITAQPRHNSVLLEVNDDGGGISYDGILSKARALGLVAGDVNPSREQLLPMIFRPGFSTGTVVTDLAGRGVGLDVVARDIAALNGSLLVESKDGEGTVMRMVLPMMTTIDEVLLLHTGNQCYALGSDFVEQAVAVEPQQFVDVDGQRMLQVRNELFPVLLLGPLVDEAPLETIGTALLLRAGERAMALVVDRVEPQREAVIRPLGRVLEAHPFLSGATISGDGTVIFTLHVARLFDVLAAESAHQATFLLGTATDSEPPRPRAILVVDDSISVRKLTSRFLETEGLQVDTAVDGIDALQKLATGRFCMVITDLEMPRMHGYELIAEIRRQSALQHLPIVVCSSRSSEKHRARAQEVGAQGYLTKPFTKEQVLAEIVRLAGADLLPSQQASV